MWQVTASGICEACLCQDDSKPQVQKWQRARSLPALGMGARAQHEARYNKLKGISWRLIHQWHAWRVAARAASRSISAVTCSDLIGNSSLSESVHAAAATAHEARSRDCLSAVPVVPRSCTTSLPPLREAGMPAPQHRREVGPHTASYQHVRDRHFNTEVLCGHVRIPGRIPGGLCTSERLRTTCFRCSCGRASRATNSSGALTPRSSRRSLPGSYRQAHGSHSTQQPQHTGFGRHITAPQRALAGCGPRRMTPA